MKWKIAGLYFVYKHKCHKLVAGAVSFYQSKENKDVTKHKQERSVSNNFFPKRNGPVYDNYRRGWIAVHRRRSRHMSGAGLARIYGRSGIIATVGSFSATSRDSTLAMGCQGKTESWRSSASFGDYCNSRKLRNF